MMSRFSLILLFVATLNPALVRAKPEAKKPNVGILLEFSDTGMKTHCEEELGSLNPKFNIERLAGRQCCASALKTFGFDVPSRGRAVAAHLHLGRARPHRRGLSPRHGAGDLRLAAGGGERVHPMTYLRCSPAI